MPADPKERGGPDKWTVVSTQNATGERVEKYDAVQLRNFVEKKAVYGVALNAADPGELLEVAFLPKAAFEDKEETLWL